MSSIFSQDSKLMTVLNMLADIAIGSVLWTLGCLSIVLAGPVSCALYESMDKAVIRMEGKLLPVFWASLKRNLKRGALCFLLFVLAGVILAAWILFAYLQGAGSFIGKLYLFAALPMAAIVMLLSQTVFPLLTKTDVPLVRVLGLSVVVSGRLLWRGLLLLLALVLEAAAISFFPLLLCLLPGMHFVWIDKLFGETLDAVAAQEAASPCAATE